MIEIIDLSGIIIYAFDWDKGNRNKNIKKHKVTNEESEQIFFNEPLVIFEDTRHSQKEKRLVAYGITDEKRALTIVFTIRKDKIRMISARSQNKKERRLYEKNKKNSTI